MAALMLFAAAWAGGYLFPWWWPALAGYALGLWRPRSAAGAFCSGFAGVAAAWASAAAVQDLRNHHILAVRIAQVFHIPGGGPLAVTALLGGLMGGLACLAGYSLRAWLWPRSAPAAPAPVPEAARKAAADTAGSDNAVAGEPLRGVDDAGLPMEPEPEPEVAPAPEPDPDPIPDTETTGDGDDPEPPRP